MEQLLVDSDLPFSNSWLLISTSAQVIILGIPDKIIEHGSPKQLQHEAGFDAEAIYTCREESVD